MKLKIIAGALVAVFAQVNLSNAAPLNCTGGCIDQSYANAVFTTTEIKPAGTGVSDTFVQIQRRDNEQGYNTTVNGVFDNSSSDVHNHEILLSEVPLKIINGVTYREFALDTNEPAATSEISLDGLKLYLSDTPNQSTTTLSSLGALVYGLDAAADNTVLLDSDFIGAGSGSSDLFVYIPNSLFVATLASVSLADPYVYLWSRFGLADDCETGSGFEEWKVQSAANVPEPATAALLTLGLGALARRRKSA